MVFVRRGSNVAFRFRSYHRFRSVAMPFVLIIAGTILLISATRNTQATLYTLLAGDFTGSNNFIYWFLSILVIGAIGYIPKMKPLSEGFLVLVILQLFIHKDTGFFDQFNKQIA